jgi:hypothetical protein
VEAIVWQQIKEHCDIRREIEIQLKAMMVNTMIDGIA